MSVSLWYLSHRSPEGNTIRYLTLLYVARISPTANTCLSFLSYLGLTSDLTLLSSCWLGVRSKVKIRYLKLSFQPPQEQELCALYSVEFSISYSFQQSRDRLLELAQGT